MTPDDLLPALALGFVLAVLWHASRRSEHAPAQTWDNEKVVPGAGGVLRRARPAVADHRPLPPLPVVPRVLPSALLVKTRRDPETGAQEPQWHVWRNKDTGTVHKRRAGMELMHPAMATDHTAAAKLITDLWRYPTTILEEEDGA